MLKHSRIVGNDVSECVDEELAEVSHKHIRTCSILSSLSKPVKVRINRGRGKKVIPKWGKLSLATENTEHSKGLLRFVVVCNRVGYLSRKVQICIRIDEELLKEMEKIKEETGIPISRQIELRLRGYAIVKAEDLRKAKLAPNPFELALRGTKFAKITFEEFEKASEELQDELLST